MIGGGSAGRSAGRRARASPDGRLGPSPSGWRSPAGVLGTIVTLGILYALSRWMRKKSTRCRGTNDDRVVFAWSGLVSMHHHFIDRFAMGDSPDPSPRRAGQAPGRAGLHGRADQLRPLRRGRPGAHGGVAAGPALVRPCAGLVRAAACGDPQPVHPHVGADEPDLRSRSRTTRPSGRGITRSAAAGSRRPTSRSNSPWASWP